jgi:hypothetical protein
MGWWLGQGRMIGFRRRISVGVMIAVRPMVGIRPAIGTIPVTVVMVILVPVVVAIIMPAAVAIVIGNGVRDVNYRGLGWRLESRFDRNQRRRLGRIVSRIRRRRDINRSATKLEFGRRR